MGTLPTIRERGGQSCQTKIHECKRLSGKKRWTAALLVKCQHTEVIKLFTRSRLLKFLTQPGKTRRATAPKSSFPPMKDSHHFAYPTNTCANMNRGLVDTTSSTLTDTNRGHPLARLRKVTHEFRNEQTEVFGLGTHPVSEKDKRYYEKLKGDPERYSVYLARRRVRSRMRPTYPRKRTRKREKVRAWVNEYLASHPCTDCGEADIIVLEFDHVRGNKDRDIAQMISDRLSLTRVILEIEKCEVRCANCHRRKTRSRTRVPLEATEV